MVTMADVGDGASALGDGLRRVDPAPHHRRHFDVQLVTMWGQRPLGCSSFQVMELSQ
jgi:hypothetical protein